MSWASYYDEFAERYDAFTAAHGWLPNQVLAEVLDDLALAPVAVLDLGAGTGQTATALRGLYPHARLRLVEESRAMAAIAAGKHPGAEVVVGSVEDHLTADRSTYDLVTAVGVLELVRDLPATLAESAARVSPGGHLAVTHEPLEPLWEGQHQPVSTLDAELDRRVRRHSRAEVEEVAVAAGLSRVTSRDLVAYQRGQHQDHVVYELVVWQAPS